MMKSTHQLQSADATALILGGTGMLASASAQISRMGFKRVWTPSRRGPTPEGCEWFECDWRNPDRLEADLASRLTDDLDLLLVWVHYPYRQHVLAVLDKYVADSTAVVEVWSHAGARPDEWDRLAAGAQHSHVLLGRGGPHGESWLDDRQISTAVVKAVQNAWLRNSAPAVTVAGVLEPSAESVIRKSLGFPT